MLMKYETGCRHKDHSEVVLYAEPAATRFDQAASANDERFERERSLERRMRRERRANASAERGMGGWRVSLW